MFMKCPWLHYKNMQESNEPYVNTSAAMLSEQLNSTAFVLMWTAEDPIGEKSILITITLLYLYRYYSAVPL